MIRRDGGEICRVEVVHPFDTGELYLVPPVCLGNDGACDKDMRTRIEIDRCMANIP